MVALAAFALGRKPGEMRDFEVYWTAAGRAAAAQPLYRTADGHYQFKYLPAFAVIASPVAKIPLETAKRGWFVASVALLCVLLSTTLGVLPERRRLAALIIVGTIVVMGKFYGHELVLGQVNLLFAVVATLGISMLIGGEVMAASLLFVLAVVIKPYAVLFLPWVAVLHGWRAIAVIAVGSVAVVTLPAALYGFEGTLALHQQWWDVVTTSTAPNLTNADNVSLAGAFAKWMGQTTPAAVLALALGGVLLLLATAAILAGRHIRGREGLEGSLLLILIPLLSPQGWDYVFLIATPAVALLINYARSFHPAVRVLLYATLATIGLSLFDIMGRERYALFMSWSVMTVCFVVLFALLVQLRYRGTA